MAKLIQDPERRYLDWFHAVADVYWRYHAEQRAAVNTPEQWQERRNYLKAVFLDAIGGLPQPGELKARSFGQLDFGTHCLERVVFESVPDLTVTANLYLPAHLEKPTPGIVVPCGHSDNGKAFAPYRTLCHALAMKGYVALIYDPLGQGERRLYRRNGESMLGGCTSQHTHLGVQLATVGFNLARYMIFDTMRAIDYLLTRPEVDPMRIGCTGCSGGGTNTAYASAIDERIAASLPVCYITTLEARQRSENIADYEQNLYGQIERGLDHHEYIAMVAPRAVCIGASTEDFFPLEGVRETYAAARRIYEVLGVADRCEMVEVEGPHGYLPELRRAAYSFFSRWFGVAADDEEPEIELPDEADLLCFPKGVAADATYRVCLSHAGALAERLIPQQVPADELREELEALVVHVPEECASRAAEAPDEGMEALEGWEVLEVQATGAPPLLLTRRPTKRPVSVAVVGGVDALPALPPEVGAAIVLPASVVPSLAERAEGVAGDQPQWPWIHSRESFLAFYAQLLGRDWVYLRAAQVLAGLHALGEGHVRLRAEGTLAMPALYAAALDRRIIALTLVRPLWAYASLLAREVHILAPPEVPYGVLGDHDLPQVMGLLAPRELQIEQPLGADGRPLRRDELDGLEELTRAYAAAGAPEALRVEA